MLRKKPLQVVIFGISNAQKSSFGEVLGASLGNLGVSWAVLVGLGRFWGVLWVHLGASEGVLEASWGHLGASWGDLGRILRGLGSLLGIFWEYFWTIFCNFN